ncbi:MAG: Sb-PDE family phosphodiesterase [Flavobacteriaceae bacterium]|nr:Sb-PDE family phosphodiesterase [Flavobacteriaceae bacterium]
MFEVPAKGSITLQIKTGVALQELSLKLKALKAYTAPKTQVVAEWRVVPQS